MMCSVADHLMPFFEKGSLTEDFQRRMALSAIDAYCRESRADYVNVARTVAFSLAAVALLGKAMSSADMPLKEQMRVYGRANALNRSADQSERSMMERRRYSEAHPPETRPRLWPVAPEPEPPISDAELEAAVSEALREFHAARASAAQRGAPPEPAQAPAAAPHPAASPAQPPALSPAAPAPAAKTPSAAIRYTAPTPKTGQSGAASFKDNLMRHTAMPGAGGQNGTAQRL
jgi:hypothetical protein